eukprot:8610219-Alexandrium_andersonii.AAC.1
MQAAQRRPASERWSFAELRAFTALPGFSASLPLQTGRGAPSLGPPRQWPLRHSHRRRAAA